jgi:hypothetical protein
MTRQNFLLLVCAAGVGLFGVYALAAKPRVPKTGFYTVDGLYGLIKSASELADFSVACKDAASASEQKSGKHTYVPMTAAECESSPSLIAGSISVNNSRAVTKNGKSLKASVLNKNRTTPVMLQKNSNLLKFLASSNFGLFLSDTKTVKEFVKKTLGKEMDRNDLVEKYGNLLLSFDLYDADSKSTYRFFLVDPYPVKARVTAMSVTYPVLTAIISKWQW